MASSSYDKIFFDQMKSRSSRSAEVILSLVFEWLGKPHSVIDVGCGLGIWLQVCRKMGVEEILGVDGEWVNRDELVIPHESFVTEDLSCPKPQSRRFELVICMEVAEHLPDACADRFVTYLTSLSDRVLFSAAVPGQGGTHHVNEQWPPYWAEGFAGHGYLQLDPIRPQIWRDPKVEVCYRQNTFLYVLESVVAADLRLARESELTRQERLTLLGKGLAWRSREPSIKTSLKLLSKAVRRSIRSYLRQRELFGRSPGR